jgi:hypothetical protein
LSFLLHSLALFVAGLLIGDIDGAKCLGQAQLLIGRVQQDKLLLATRTQSVGRLPVANGRSMQVQKIRRVTLLSLQPDADLRSQSFDVRLPVCPLHEQTANWIDNESSSLPLSPSNTSTNILATIPDPTVDPNAPAQTQMGKTWHSIKSTSGRLINRASSSMVSAGGSLVLSTHHTGTGSVAPGTEIPGERTQRRILDEIVKMFSESDSFYFSEDADLSRCLQRSERQSGPNESKDASTDHGESSTPLGHSNLLVQPILKDDSSDPDDRFFFNRHMLSFLNDQDPNARPWLIPVIQGFVQIERCRLPAADPLEPEIQFDLALISRRSRHRAGTRYKRRGTDDQGHAANFVESEQMLCTSGHVLSFVQTRGSVPVHWAQPGVSYRPAPVLERSREDNRDSFGRHFEHEFAQYGPVTAINLVEQSGREKVLADAYLCHVLDLDDPKLTYVSFDFHEIW